MKGNYSFDIKLRRRSLFTFIVVLDSGLTSISLNVVYSITYSIANGLIMSASVASARYSILSLS